MLIGYARVSTPSQNLDRQIAALRDAHCDRIFAEKASGRSTGNRPELKNAIAALGAGDVLVLAEWDRATRSMMDGVSIMAQVIGKHASVKALDKDWLDLTTPIGKGFLAFMSALAEDERNRIVERSAGGRQAAKARGVSVRPETKAQARSARSCLCSHGARVQQPGHRPGTRCFAGNHRASSKGRHLKRNDTRPATRTMRRKANDAFEHIRHRMDRHCTGRVSRETRRHLSSRRQGNPSLSWLRARRLPKALGQD